MKCVVSRDTDTSARRVDIKTTFSLWQLQYCTCDSSSTRGAVLIMSMRRGYSGSQEDARDTSKRHHNESGRHHEPLDLHLARRGEHDESRRGKKMNTRNLYEERRGEKYQENARKTN